MKKVLLFLSVLSLHSCNRELFGIYDSKHLDDKTVYFQIKLNRDHTVEKTEEHTILDYAKGRFITNGRNVICFLDTSKYLFPPDTLIYKLKGDRLYFTRGGVVSKKIYLVKK